MEKKTIDILLIEDNKADIRIIQELLKTSKEFSVDLESNPRLSESMDLLKAKNYDIILLDLTLPDSDRESTLESVLNVTKEIPIIILTGLDDKDFALKSLQKGAQDYIVKDELNGPNLIRAILYAIERHKIETEKIVDKALKVPFDEKDKEILNFLKDNYSRKNRNQYIYHRRQQCLWSAEMMKRNPPVRPTDKNNDTRIFAP